MVDNSNLTLALLSLFLPLLSFSILILFGKKIGDKAHLVSLALIGGMLAIAIRFFSNIFHHGVDPILEISIQWFTTGKFNVHLGFLINNVAAIMLLVVALISFLVHLLKLFANLTFFQYKCSSQSSYLNLLEVKK